MSPHSHHPPGTRPPRRFRPRLHWELVICSLRGHALVGRHAAALRAQDAIFAREDAAGVRWFRCLRCDSWLPLPAPEQTTQEQHPPAREQIELPLRGKPLRDKVVLRLIAVDRAFHFVVLVGLGVLVLLFAADRATLRDTFYKVITDLQGGVAASQSHAHGILHEIDNAFTTSSSHLHLVGAVLLAYGAVEGIEAFGLWYQRRWAEYLTFLVTASLLPLEVYELATRATVFKAIAFVINVAVVVYLLRAKRLFGLRGGVAAEHAEAAIDQGWEALERTAPPVAASPRDARGLSARPKSRAATHRSPHVSSPALVMHSMTRTREDLRFTSGTETCAAWLYPAAEPADATGEPAVTSGGRITNTKGPGGATIPLIVMGHGMSGTRRDRLGAFAERFAAAGVAAVVFDHRGFGDSDGEPDLFDPALQLEDWRAAIAFGRSLPRIDGDRVATFGSSMGGGNALAAAAEDQRIAAAISQVPFLDIVLQAHRSSPRVTAKVLAAAARGRHLPVLGEPNEAALLNAPGAAAGWRHVVAIGEDSRWRDRISTGWLLGRPYRPGRKAAKLHCPWLVCVGEADRVARPGPAIAAAHRAPLGELRTYPGVDHFDIYDGPAHEALVADQLAFLRRHLLGGRENAAATLSRA